MERWSLRQDLLYSAGHTWARPGAGVATVGLTDFAQAESHRIAFVGLPRPGERVRRGQPCGYIYSVTRGIWDLYPPVDGRVVAINEEIWAHPEMAQQSPYEEGWLLQLEMEDPGELEDLQEAPEYARWLEVALSRHPDELLPQPAEGEAPATWLVIEEGRQIVVCGKGCEAVTGWRSWELAGRTTCMDVYRCQDAQGPLGKDRCPGLACFQNMGPVRQAEYTILTRGGRSLAIQADYSVVPAPLGRPRRALVRMSLAEFGSRNSESANRES